jgi:hypothetical protein
MNDKTVIQSIEDWDKQYSAGKQYRATAHKAVAKPEIFTPSIIRNIAAMGIEAYFMALFMHRGILPRNHTMQDLLFDAKRLFSVDPELERIMLKIDDQMQLCSIENFKLTDATQDDIKEFLQAIDMTATIVDKELVNA